MSPTYKSKEKYRVVAYWTCENPRCLVIKVRVRVSPGRLEVKKANAL